MEYIKAKYPNSSSGNKRIYAIPNIPPNTINKMILTIYIHFYFSFIILESLWLLFYNFKANKAPN